MCFSGEKPSILNSLKSKTKYSVLFVSLIEKSQNRKPKPRLEPEGCTETECRSDTERRTKTERWTDTPRVKETEIVGISLQFVFFLYYCSNNLFNDSFLRLLVHGIRISEMVLWLWVDLKPEYNIKQLWYRTYKWEYYKFASPFIYQKTHPLS